MILEIKVSYSESQDFVYLKSNKTPEPRKTIFFIQIYVYFLNEPLRLPTDFDRAGHICQIKSKIMQKFDLLLPTAGVHVEVSAGEALVATPSLQNPPSFVSAADLDPDEV